MFDAEYAGLPVWLLTTLFFAALLAGRELGAYLKRRRIRNPGESHNPLTDAQDNDAIEMTSVLGLLALLIGFAFSLALQRYDSRRELVIREANAIGTTWLRADLLDEPARSRMRDVLRRYTDARITFGSARTSTEEQKTYTCSEALQAELWGVATFSVAEFRGTPRASMIITTTNESIDLAAERLATRQAHIPLRILRMLLLFSVLAAGLVGYERGHQRNATTLLLLLFALAVGLVMDLDRPSTGMTNVPQTPMIELRRSMGT